MDSVRQNADLNSRFDELYELCRETKEPVYINNGESELAVLDVAVCRNIYEQLTQYKEIKAREELYKLLEEGMDDLKNGRYRPAAEVFADIRKEINK